MIGNWRDEPVSLIVRLDREGSTVFEEAIGTDTDGEELIEQSWDTDSAKYTIMYSAAYEGKIYRLSLPDDAADVNGECIDIQIQCRQSDADIVFQDDSPPWGQC